MKGRPLWLGYIPKGMDSNAMHIFKMIFMFNPLEPSG
jgi:hypothetical protein